MKLSMSLVFLALAVSACSFHDQQRLKGVAESIASDLGRDPDNSLLLVGHPQLVRRDGRVLRVRTNGRWRAFVDRYECVGFDTCERYRARLFWRGRFVGIESNYGEGGGYSLIDVKNGKSYEIEGAPHFSPSDGKFAVAEYAGYDPGTGPTVWSVSNDGNITMTKSFVGQINQPEFIAWRGDHCFEVKGYDGKYQPVSAFIAANADGWHMAFARLAVPVCEQG